MKRNTFDIQYLISELYIRILPAADSLITLLITLGATIGR